MNSKLMAPGTGGASAILVIWWLHSRFGVQATPEQTAALATALSVVYGFFDDILAACKELILAALRRKVTSETVPAPDVQPTSP